MEKPIGVMMIIPEPTEIDKRMRRRGEADGDDDDVRWREKKENGRGYGRQKRGFKPKKQKKQREVPRAKKGTRGSVQTVQFSSVACMCPFVMQH